MHIRYVYIYMQIKWTQLLHSTINSSLNSTPRSKCYCLKVRTWQCYMSFHYSVHLSQCEPRGHSPEQVPCQQPFLSCQKMCGSSMQGVWIQSLTVEMFGWSLYCPVQVTAARATVCQKFCPRLNQNTATVSLCSSVDQRPVMSPSCHSLSPHYCYCTRNTWPSMQHDLWPVFLLSDNTPPVKALMKPVGLSLSLLTFAEVIVGQRESTLAAFIVMQ